MPIDLKLLPIDVRPENVPVLSRQLHPFDPYFVRRDFPILQEQVNGRPLVWLDNAATTQKPQAVIDRLAYFYAHENSNIHRAAHTLAARATDAYEAAREKVRRFLERCFAARKSSSCAAPPKASTSWRKPGAGATSRRATRSSSPGSSITPTSCRGSMLCAEKGARLRVAPVDDRGQVILDEYEKLLGPRTRIVAFTQVSNALGTVTPAREMVEMAHRHGARVLVDGAQAVSHMPVDVQALDCDFYVFSGHKVFGPTGIGALYGKVRRARSHAALAGRRQHDRGRHLREDHLPGAAGAFRGGHRQHRRRGRARRGARLCQRHRHGEHRRYEHELLEYATERLLTVPGLSLIGTAAEKAGVLSFVLDEWRGGGCRPGARPRRHRRARRPPLRPADPAPIWARDHRASFARALQHRRGRRRAGGGSAAASEWTAPSGHLSR